MSRCTVLRMLALTSALSAPALPAFAQRVAEDSSNSKPEVNTVNSPPLWSCVTGRGTGPMVGKGVIESLPPGIKTGEQRSGIVIVRVRFESADAPPDVRVLFNSSGKHFEQSVVNHLAGYRWSCASPAKPTLEATQVFKISLDGGAPSPTHALTLEQLLSILDKLDSHRVRFDFTTMNCPFEAGFSYFQPYIDNGIINVGWTADTQRRSFYDWLRAIVLKPSLTEGDKLIDHVFKVSVPCVVLNLD